VGIRELAERLKGTPVEARLRYGVPLSQHVSFKIGGPADLFVETHDPPEIALLVNAAREAGVASFVLGLGTNLLVRDGGFRGLVVKIVAPPGGPDWCAGADPPAVVAGAGVPLARLSHEAAGRGLAGLEFAEGIPGTLGGAIVMNAGAYGGEIGSLVEWAEVLDLRSGAGPRRWTRDELGFGYRKSALQGLAGQIVTAVRLSLQRGDPAAVGAAMSEFAERRRAHQPLDRPSAGSFFMRPKGHYAGPMIEACGLKGYRVGGAMVSPKHANFILNAGGATAADVMAVASHVQETMDQRFGLWLEPEVRVIGEG